MAVRTYFQVMMLVSILVAATYPAGAQGRILSRQTQALDGHSHNGHPFAPSLGRQLLSTLTASIWPPRDPIGQAGCTGAYCTDGGWGNYGYTQAVPAGGWGSGPNFTPDGYVRPVPLARPMAGGRH